MPSKNDPQRAKVLAVDDDPFMRELLTVYLESAGYSVTTASSGEQALRAAKSQLFDAVILDVDMPGGMNGASVGNALRADPSTSAAAIAMHTSQTEDVVRSSGFGDFDVFLSKPCNLDELSESISHMLRARRGGRGEPC